MPDNLPIEPQFIIFIVVVLIGIVRSLFFPKKKEQGQAGEEHEDPWQDVQPQRPAQPQPSQDPLAEFRQMIEEAKAEAQAQQQQHAQPTPQPSSPPPPHLVTTRTVTPAQQVQASPALPYRAPQKSEAAPAPALSQKKRKRRSSVRTLLSSPSAARQAIILREVLGKPKGYR